MSHPVAAAVAPVKEEAIARAKVEAEALIAKFDEKAAAANYDLEVFAPWPKNVYSREYQVEKARYGLARRFFRGKSSLRRGEPNPGVAYPEGREKFIKESMEDAGVQYDAFVAKLVGKVGECESARLQGSHVWSFSLLFIEKAGGAREVWKSQQIVNVSKHGKLFNQWPSRLQKGAKK